MKILNDIRKLFHEMHQCEEGKTSKHCELKQVALCVNSLMLEHHDLSISEPINVDNSCFEELNNVWQYRYSECCIVHNLSFQKVWVACITVKGKFCGHSFQVFDRGKGNEWVFNELPGVTS